MLSYRKAKILKALVDNYVESAIPVSSSEIQKKYIPEISSATIRSELAALEEMGYLTQPHTSAGRVPSALAYKYYVNYCLDDYGLTKPIIDDLEACFKDKINDVEQVMKETAKIISDITNYTSIVVMGGYENLTIENIKVVDLSNKTALVIVVTNGGILKDKMINLPDGMSGNYLSSRVKALNDIFVGTKINELSNISYECKIDETIQGFNYVFNEIYDVLKDYRHENDAKIYLEGADKIFQHKEYEDVMNVKNFLSVIGEKEELMKIMDTKEGIELDIKIGKDDSSKLENMALISATYKINGVDIGHRGVIGPERMDYQKVIKVLNEIQDTLVNMVDKKE